MTTRQPPAVGKFKAALLGIGPLTDKRKEAMRVRVERWMRRDTWQLWEACDLAYHIIPDRLIRWFYFIAGMDSDFLRGVAVRAVQAGALKVGNPEAPEEQWWVLPLDFARWAARRPDWIGTDRAEVFRTFVPAELPGNAAYLTRKRVLESSYSAPEFEAVLAAIEKFWLPALEGGETPYSKTIIDWLDKTYGFDDKALKRIDTLIRTEEAKSGGRRPSPQKTQ